MDDTDETDALIGRARDAMDDIVALGRALLALGADIDRVHRGYIVVAFDLLGEAEALPCSPATAIASPTKQSSRWSLDSPAFDRELAVSSAVTPGMRRTEP